MAMFAFDALMDDKNNLWTAQIRAHSGMNSWAPLAPVTTDPATQTDRRCPFQMARLTTTQTL